MTLYTIGIDYGSLSARGVLMDIETGQIAASSVFPYPAGILTTSLPDGTPIPPDWAIQVPDDYRQALSVVVHDLISSAGIEPRQVVGIGLDTTSCTFLPTLRDGTPLCELPPFTSEPHAYLKLWKHHSSQKYSPRIESMVYDTYPEVFSQYGGAISSEHFYPKIAQLAAEAPAVYQAADRFEQAGDWLVHLLCGEESRGYCAAAYKMYYDFDRGDFPDRFLSEIHPLLASLHDKQAENVIYPGDCAGYVSEDGSRLTGLAVGTPVSASGVDAHVTVNGCHLTQSGDFLLILGTSTCMLALSREYHEVPGISGVVPNGILPELNAYEAGQSCVGDMFAWFTANCVPEAYNRRAAARGISIHQYLSEKAAALEPGESGLIALDWWNGVRSTLMDFDLSGLLLGLTIQTTPEEIYRALLEATAFGAKTVIDAMEERGVPINTLYASGGIATKNPLMLQIYADICEREIRVVDDPYSAATGSAILGLAASSGGFPALTEHTTRYYRAPAQIYSPDADSAAQYRKLYQIYRELYQHFGRASGAMKQLKQLKLSAKAAHTSRTDGQASAFA